MSNRLADAVVVGLSLSLATASSAYMYFLRAPSVASVRPELTEVGWWTALFSGRFNSWMWLHYPAVMVVVTFAIFVGFTLPVILK